ncbi:Lebercilin [Schistosoma haematobium]|uniref:Lebercilin n=3 Tax=Schistosoma haematobium TaxID=6185 RepID=A0A922LEM6_SCHHA|nr:Lebercilin [Schistosoma haematobium]KAH9580891.1 Lebercilin [Schistosoma haematobium]CAH8600091.1 unnamed protein product [Schistosoma haematobium]
MCNLLPNYQVTPDCSETYETDSEFAYSENKDIKSSEASRQKSKQNKESNPNTKSPLKTINYKSKLSQHNSIIKPSSHSKFDHVSSTSSSKKSNFNKKFSSSVLDRWESNQFALADANSLIIQLNKELKDCKLELKTLQRQYKMQAVRLDKAIGQEADMPQIVDRLNSEIRTLQVRLREKTLQSCVDQRKIHELQQRIYVLEKTIDEKHNQSQYTDEGSSVSHKRNNKNYDISIELQEEKKKNSQLKHQLDVLTKNHKQQINMNNEKLRNLQQEYQHLKDKLHERTQQLQEKTKLLELQNVYSHRIPKNLILSHLSSLSSIYSTTNEMENHNDHKEETSKSNNPLIDQYKCNSNDKYSPRLPPITVNDNNNNKINNDVSLSSQYVTMCKGLEQMPRIDNNIESNLEGYPLMINGKLSNDNEHHVDEIKENSSKEVIGNHQSNDFNLQNNKENQMNNNNDLSIDHNQTDELYTTQMKQESNINKKNTKNTVENEIEDRKYKLHLIQTLQEIDKKDNNHKQYENDITSQFNALHNPVTNSKNNNTGKTREEELWNDLFGSIKDNVNKTSEVINQHQSSNNGILFSNNSNIINASIHNSNWKTGINQRNNNNNQDNLKDTFKQPSWLAFHKTVNQLSNESNMINNRNSFNRLIDHNITAQLDNIDNDIEVLQI